MEDGRPGAREVDGTPLRAKGRARPSPRASLIRALIGRRGHRVRTLVGPGDGRSRPASRVAQVALLHRAGWETAISNVPRLLFLS